MAVELSILVCGLENREAPRAALLAHLQEQISSLDDPSRVEVLVAVDNGKEAIGRKRNNLLERAQGIYIAYVDDDDWVAPYYVAEILRLLAEHPGVDCLSFRGIITTDGKDPHFFEHSLTCTEWYTKEGIYYRCPNHLNPVRRELAAQVGFPPIDHGEDHHYSRKLFPLLTTHAMLPEVMYYYRYRTNKRAPITVVPDPLPTIVAPTIAAPIPAPVADAPEAPGGTVASANLPFPVSGNPPPTRGPSGMPYPPPALLMPNVVSIPGGSPATALPSSATPPGRGRRRRTT